MYFQPIKYKKAKHMIKVNIGAVILKYKDGDKPSGKCDWYEYSSPGIECPKSFADAISAS